MQQIASVIWHWMSFFVNNKVSWNISLTFSRHTTKKKWPFQSHFFCREDRIRTCDPLVPNQVRYRPALLPGAIWLLRKGCKNKGISWKQPTLLLLFWWKNCLPAISSEKTAGFSRQSTMRTQGSRKRQNYPTCQFCGIWFASLLLLFSKDGSEKLDWSDRLRKWIPY